MSSSRSREAAFDLLIRLTGDDVAVLQKFIEENLHKLVTDYMPVPDKWGVRAFTKSTKYQKYVGLRNMGTTCYMNSILQQWFMIPSFRYNILGIENN